MTIHFGCIARGTTVLCSHQTKNGNFSTTLQSMLPNISTQSDSKRTYTSNSYEYHCLIENGILYVCATNAGIAKTQPYGFLNEMRKRLQSASLSARAMTGGPGDLDSEFGSILVQQMQKYSENGAGSSSAVATVQAQVHEVKEVMSQNIEKVLQRGERLEDLLDKSEELEAGAVNFSRTAKKIQKRYWWRNKKMTIILVVVALVVILIITLIILFATHTLPPSSNEDNKTTHKP
ncbi:vesicle-associated membrane protein 7 [Biomphalaria glabrata]|uniref:Vesicle-associated membrane protein 7 n=1 Tax=Biomphalaria glabrata TaxID=6526 RepID=A0A2C9LTZ3_BIOGL|nr:vesicle-associated membrane protein 7 [Biomphalaria glabrata]